MDRNINSPDALSSIVISPSGVKRARFPYMGGFIIGSSPDDTANVKLHLGPNGTLQIVEGDDTTPEGQDSPNKASVSMFGIAVENLTAAEMLIGSSSTAVENVKLRKSGLGQLEIVTGDTAVAEGTPAEDKRAPLKAKNLTLGTNKADPSQNIKLNRNKPNQENTYLIKE